MLEVSIDISLKGWKRIKWGVYKMIKGPEISGRDYCTQRNLKAGLILGLRPANERRRYFVTTSLIGWVQA